MIRNILKKPFCYLGILISFWRNVYLYMFLFLMVFLLPVKSLFGETEKEKAVYAIDWVRMELSIMGSGAITTKENGNPIEWQHDAVLRAQKDLLKNYLSSMKLLRLDAYRSGWSFLEKNPEQNESIYFYIESHKPYSVKYNNHTVTVSKTVPLFGENGLARLFIAAGTDTGNFPDYDKYVYSTPFTGLVIDARGLDRIPALAPRIYDEDHNVVYSAELIKRSSFERWGSAQYTENPYYRGFEDRVGKNPYRVVAIKNEKLIPTDIALSNEDAMILLQTDQTRRNLEEGRVVIVIDSKVIVSSPDE